MKRRKNPFVLLCAMLLAVFLLNMAVMYVFFDINLLHLPELLWINMESNRSGGVGSLAGSKAGEAGSTDSAAANDAEAGNETGRDSKTSEITEAKAGNQAEAGNEAETRDSNSAAGSEPAGSESAGSGLKPDSAGKGYFLTRAQISSFEHLSLDDSLIALDIASRIGMKESKRIFDMSLDGITIEEYEEIKKSVGDKLSESDIIAIEKLLNRSLLASGSEAGDN